MFRICPSSIPLTRREPQFPHNRFKFPLPLITGNTSPTFGARITRVLGLGSGITLSFRSNFHYSTSQEQYRSFLLKSLMQVGRASQLAAQNVLNMLLLFLIQRQKSFTPEITLIPLPLLDEFPIVVQSESTKSIKLSFLCKDEFRLQNLVLTQV